MMTFEEARRKARYGHRDYIAIPNGDDETYELLTVGAIKRALLRVGTQGSFCVIAANNACLHLYNWRIGLNMMRNAKHLGIPA